ncbi:MAG: sulfatase [Candidatus Aminicenantes bacterium]|nr:sulfatase [Candidatus Aminicenantes bacterium]
MKKWTFLLVLALAVAAWMLPACRREKPAGRTALQPNILVIMSDDHAAHAISAYGSRLNATPQIDRIAREGMLFANCFCTNAICAPSRAVILTGRYSHLNGVRDNAVAFDGAQTTFPKLLQKAGYQTALIGKWHLKSDPTGFDYWTVLPGQGEYYNPDFIEMGVRKRREGYVTDILSDLAVDFLERSRDPSRPFLLMLHHKAPHRAWQPAPRHLNLFDEADIPLPETLFDDYSGRSRAALEQEMSVKDHFREETDLKMGPPPERLNAEQREIWEKAYGPKRAAFLQKRLAGRELVLWKYRRYMEDYLGCIAAVDESVGRVLDALERSGASENTLVIYTSDQGFFLGDHGWYDKRFMYEESLRMPLLVKLPGSIPAGSVNDELVLNLDFGPTFLELAGVPVPADMQGRSFAGLLFGQKAGDWRKAVYYHYYEYPAVHMVKRHYGIRTRQFKLIHFYHDIDAWELYDLEKDPEELMNVYEDPAYLEARRELAAELLKLQGVYGDPPELARKFVHEDLKR